jgi:asparagine synthase (glutamine-hydrolysing)
VWVVFNGEIYNFRELRSELKRLGHVFYTESDTETIVHLYEQYGKRCVEKLRGMFAFAVWDERRKTVLLARDRLGKKPLYYGWVGPRLVFASELKSVLQLREVDRGINWNSLSHLLTFLCTPSSESIIEGIRKLEPGHVLVAARGGNAQLERYWKCEFKPEFGKTEQYFVDRLRGLIEESVRIRLVSDVPVGAFLSGGIDSAAVVAMMARATGERIKTFSIGFDETDFNELGYARMVAERFGTEHHELILQPDAVDILDDLAWYLDEPFGDSSAIPTYMVSKLASEHVKVLLSGDGGDEVFAGYDKYVVEAAERRQESLPSYVRNLLGLVGSVMPEGMRGRHFVRHKALTGPERYLDSTTLFRAEEKKRLFRPEIYDRIRAYDPRRPGLELLGEPNRDWLSALQLLDLNSYLPLDILTKVDRMSMAHSIETRAPLLDHKLVEFAATIPPDLKLRGCTTKHIFKQAMRGILPDEIIDRRKQGFAIPLGRWFRGRLAGFAHDLLSSETCRNRGVFNPAYVEQLIKRHQNGRELDLHLWTLISFELWCRTFLDTKRPAANPVNSTERRFRSNVGATL